MKKWLKFFALSFFLHKYAKEAPKRDYANVFLGFILALVFLWSGFVGGAMLPFGAHYNSSPDFAATAHAALSNSDTGKRIVAEIEDGALKLKRYGGEYAECLLVNTFENDADKENYSVNGYNIVVDSRPASALAEVEAYAVSNDGNDTEISYEDYLTLSEVARLNFDFKLRYTGVELKLTDETVAEYRAYLDGLSDESKATAEESENRLTQGEITKDEYNRAIYELYFENYYPEITDYESTSKVPLLRNYYYYRYISEGVKNYLFIFDDYMTGSFETAGGVEVSFHGFYSSLEDGYVVAEGASQDAANASVDGFIKNSFKATGFLNSFAYALNIFSLLPFIAIMIMVATMLTYSILRLRGVESIVSLGAMFKTVGSFVWFSGAAAAALTVIAAFFVKSSLLNALPSALFFAVLAIRSVIFAVKENKSYTNQSEQREA